jgi:putative peptide zinc metalloprotease protein
MTEHVLVSAGPQWTTSVLQRVPGTRLLGKYEGGGYVEDRFLVVRPDGQPVLLTRLAYLVVRYCDGTSIARVVADRVSRDYGRRLSPELLSRLVRERLAPAGIVLAPPPEGHRGDDDEAADPAAPDVPPSGVHPVLAAAPSMTTTRPPEAPRAEPLLAVTLSQAFLPAHAVRRVAAWLAPLFHPAAVAAVLAAFAACDVWLLLGPGLGRGGDGAGGLLADPADLLAVLGLLALATLIHELGHAAGCRFGGGRPGAIGAGLYLWFLVFWTDVTDAYRLDRPGRLRTDLGGIYFNAVYVVLATAGYALTGWAPLAVSVIFVNIIALQQLMPIIRMDGYYILGDLTGVPNLFGLLLPTLRSLIPGRPADPRVAGLRPWVRRVVVLWSLTSAALLTLALVLLVLAAPMLAGTTWRQISDLWREAGDSRTVSGTVFAWILIVFLVLPFVGFAALVVRAARRVARPGSLRTGARISKGESIVKPNPAQLVVAREPSQEVPSEQAERPVVPPLPSPPRLTAADFTEDLMLREHRRPPSRGWRRQVFLATGGLVHPGPSAAERREAEMIARVRTRLGTPRRIVVLSRKGGAGKTTTTLMLGHTLAIHRGDRVVALDANPDAGSLPYRIERESSATVTSLLAAADRLSSYAQVRTHTSQAPSRLEIVASDDDPKITHALGKADFAKVIRLLDQHYMLMLMDTGTGILDDATQGLLEQADQIVVVMPPALDGARVAASTLDWLDEHGFRDLVRGAVAVINGVRTENGLVQLEAIEDHFQARCAGVVQIPWDNALEAGARTSLEDLRPVTRKAYLELAAQVAECFTGGSGRTR